MLWILPSNDWPPRASTSTVTRWPTRMSRSCVSLKLAVTQTSSVFTSARSGCPAWTTCPASTVFRLTMPSTGALTMAYSRFGDADRRRGFAHCRARRFDGRLRGIGCRHRRVVLLLRDLVLGDEAL